MSKIKKVLSVSAEVDCELHYHGKDHEIKRIDFYVHTYEREEKRSTGTSIKKIVRAEFIDHKGKFITSKNLYNKKSLDSVSINVRMLYKKLTNMTLKKIKRTRKKKVVDEKSYDMQKTERNEMLHSPFSGIVSESSVWKTQFASMIESISFMALPCIAESKYVQTKFRKGCPEFLVTREKRWVNKRVSGFTGTNSVDEFNIILDAFVDANKQCNNYFKCIPEMLKNETRGVRIQTICRHAFMYIAWKLGKSKNAVGRFLGRHHSSVIFGIENTKNLIEAKYPESKPVRDIIQKCHEIISKNKSWHSSDVREVAITVA